MPEAAPASSLARNRIVHDLMARSVSEHPRDGLSHLELVDMPVSKLLEVAAVQFTRSSTSAPIPRTMAFHNAPHRRYVVTLSGTGEIVVWGDPDRKFIADRDHILLART
jgi:hypothetical protein